MNVSNVSDAKSDCLHFNFILLSDDAERVIMVTNICHSNSVDILKSTDSKVTQDHQVNRYSKSSFMSHLNC